MFTSALKKSRMLISAVLSIVLVCTFLAISASAASTYGVDLNSSAYESTENPFYSYYKGQCTWYVWGRAYEKVGVALPAFNGDSFGNAIDWYSNASTYAQKHSDAPFAVGTTPRVNSIMVSPTGGYTDEYGKYHVTGHVLFVEKIENGFAYVTEGNYAGNSYHEDTIDLSTGKRGSSNSYLSITGYIYLDITPPAVSSYVKVSDVSEDSFTLTFEASDRMGITSVWADVRPGSSDAGAHRFQATLNGSTATVVVETGLIAFLSGSASHNYYVTCGARDTSGNTAEVHIEHERISVYPVKVYTGTFETLQDTAAHFEPCEEIDGKPTETFGYTKGASLSGVGIYTNRWGATYLLTASGDWVYADHVKYQMQWSDIWNLLNPFASKPNAEVFYFAGQVLESQRSGTASLLSLQDDAPVKLFAASGGSCITIYGNVVTHVNKESGDIPATYTVFYDANGGSGAPTSQTKTYGVNLTLSGTVPTRAGFDFLGWATDSSATSATYSAGGAYTANASVTLYAVWEQYIFSGNCGANGNNVTWTLNTKTGVLTISGTGKMAEYWISDIPVFNSPAPWYGYRSQITSVVIGDGVTCIENAAFYDCSSLTDVMMGDSVTYIGAWYAFDNCTNLKRIEVSEDNPNYSSIDGILYDKAKKTLLLYPIAGKTEYVIPDGVTNIEIRYGSLGGLTEITIPGSMTRVDNVNFYECLNLERIDVSADNPNYSSLDGVLFDKEKKTLLLYPQAGKTEYTVPDGVTRIADSAFNNCSDLTSIAIPDSITSMGAAFYGCDSLEYNIYDNAEYLGNRHNPYVCLMGTLNESIQSCTIHPDTRAIGYSAFAGCSSLSSITIPDSVAGIGKYAFSDCKNLENLIIPNSVTTIEEEAFARCRGLKSVTIPSSVKTLDKRVFYYCESLASVSISYGVTSLGTGVFAGCTSLTNITIPSSVTSIEESLFWNSGLTSVTISPGLTSIGQTMFSGCSNLASVMIPDSVTSIEWGAFSGCASLTTVYYFGREKEWRSIRIGEGNEALLNADLIYAYPTLVPGEALSFKYIPLPDGTTTVYAALYDADGRMLDIKQFSISEMDTASMTVPQDAKTAKLFFSGSNYIPIGESETLSE